MIRWIRELYDIFTEYERNRSEIRQNEKVCASCETLKTQLEVMNIERQNLIDRLLNPIQETKVAGPSESQVKIQLPKHVPWDVRRQMLEKEDRERARLMRQAPVPDTPGSVSDTDELEREMGLAQELRESQSVQSSYGVK